MFIAKIVDIFVLQEEIAEVIQFKPHELQGMKETLIRENAKFRDSHVLPNKKEIAKVRQLVSKLSVFCRTVDLLSLSFR